MRYTPIYTIFDDITQLLQVIVKKIPEWVLWVQEKFEGNCTVMVLHFLPSSWNRPHIAFVEAECDFPHGTVFDEGKQLVGEVVCAFLCPPMMNISANQKMVQLNYIRDCYTSRSFPFCLVTGVFVFFVLGCVLVIVLRFPSPFGLVRTSNNQSSFSQICIRGWRSRVCHRYQQ